MPECNGVGNYDLPVLRRLGILAVLAMLAACSIGGSTSFTLANATVAPTFDCPAGVSNAPYDLRATIDADNSTSHSVEVRAASAVMIVAAVHGSWQQPVGFRYEAGQVPVSPKTLAARTRATLNLTIPSACTDIQHQGAADYADYTVQLFVGTSAGTFRLESQNKHRIVAS
jgi:hypothetical protein